MLDNQGYLKLKADDKNDLKVFAAYLQDSITVPQDIKYLEKNFEIRTLRSTKKKPTQLSGFLFTQ